MNLNGNWQSSTIEVFTNGRDIDPNTWANDCVNFLLPHPFPLFNRNRWLKSTRHLREFALLGVCHGLLVDVFRVWLDLLKGVALNTIPVPVPSTDDTSAYDNPDVWETNDREDDEDDTHHREAPPRNGDSQAWAEFNQQQRITTSRFCTINPAASLLIGAIVLQPLVALLDMQFAVAGSAWEQQHFAHAVQHGTCPMVRMLDAFNNRITDRFAQMCVALLYQASSWVCLPAAFQTQCNLSLAYCVRLPLSDWFISLSRAAVLVADWWVVQVYRLIGQSP